MPSATRPGSVPFLLVVTTAAFLVFWNGTGIFRALTRPPAAKPPSAAAGTPLDRAAEEVRKLWEQEGVRQTDLTLRAIRSCDANSRHRATFKNLLASAPQLREPLAQAESSLSAACQMRLQLGLLLPWPQRAAADRELRSHHSLALGMIESARAQLVLRTAPPPGGSPAPRPSDLLEKFIGLFGGLICLLFARRPRAAPQQAASIEEQEGRIPADAEPATYGNTALRLLDDSGSFFFSEVFDRAPVPLVLLDGEGRILRLNAEAEDMAGQTTAEVRRKYYWDTLVPKSARRSVRDSFRSGGEKAPAAETWVTPGGDERSLVWKRTPFMEGTSGRPAMVLLAGQAPTEPSSHPVSAEANAAMLELENELTLIAGHCGLLNAAGQSYEIDADLKQMEKAVERALDAVRRLLVTDHPKT